MKEMRYKLLDRATNIDPAALEKAEDNILLRLRAIPMKPLNGARTAWKCNPHHDQITTVDVVAREIKRNVRGVVRFIGQIRIDGRNRKATGMLLPDAHGELAVK